MRRRAFKSLAAAAAVAALVLAAVAMRGRASDLAPALERPDVLAASGICLLVWLAGGAEGDVRPPASVWKAETQ